MRRIVLSLILVCLSLNIVFAQAHQAWKLQLEIDVPGLEPNAIQWALFEKDPNMYFLKGMEHEINTINAEIHKQIDPDKKKLVRNLFIIRHWESIFSHITGDKILLLPGGKPTTFKFKSRSLKSRKWITTKMIVVDGQVYCWKVGVKPIQGDTVRVKLTKDNAYNFKKTWPVSHLMRDYDTESLVQLIQRKDKGKMIDLVKTLHALDKTIVNKTDKHTLSLLMWTVGQDDLKTFKYLVSLGATLDYHNKIGMDIRDMAALLGSKDIFRSLVTEHKMSVHEKNEKGFAPIHYAALTGQLEMVKILIEEFGVNIHSKSAGGYTPLHFASAGQYPEVIEYLIRKGAQVNTQNRRGHTPLIVYGIPYIIHGELPTAIYFFYYVNAKGQLNYYNYNSFRPGAKSSLKLMLDAGADINHQDKKGWSVLHHGVSLFNEYYIRYLLELGANKRLKTSAPIYDIKEGLTPYDMASHYLEKWKSKGAMQQDILELKGMMEALK